MGGGRLEASYLLPIRRERVEDVAELTAYLEALSEVVDVVIVDGSPDEVFRYHHGLWGGSCRHVAPDPSMASLNGKAWGVNTGLRHVAHDRVVIADDDVRYRWPELVRVCALLDQAEVVRPQNYFAPLPWHALWDTGRTLLNRALDGDWPGTLGVRRSSVPHGYDGDVLFENLELWRTVRAGGGRGLVASDVFVRRLPPSSAKFWSQRVRQAYDEFARPRRLVAQLTILPVLLAVLVTCRWRLAGMLAGAVVGAAEVGRRRDGGSRHFPALASFAAPVWLAERAVCIWLAMGTRIRRGGVPYAGHVLARASTPERTLRARYRTRRS